MDKSCEKCGSPAVVFDNYGAKCAECWLGFNKDRKQQKSKSQRREK